MSNIVEILGEKKFSGSRNTELKTRVVFDESKKILYDNNLFFNISQQEQFLTEKNESNVFRIYGKINPIFNFNLHRQLSDNSDISIEVDKSIFDFNDKNWQILLLKSERIDNIKGLKNLNKETETGDTIVNLDLNKGLPGREYISETNLENFCISLTIGHNFQVGDRVKIDVIKSNTFNSGIYNIVDVEDNLVYINTRPAFVPPTEVNVGNLNRGVINLTEYTESNFNDNERLEFVSQQKIGNLLYKRNEINNIINTNRPSIQTLIKPDFYLSKVLEKELLEYYVKTLKVISIADELDLCAFSVNNFNQPYYNYYFNTNVDINDLYDNKNEPLTDLYVAIIKKGSDTLTSQTESHFGAYIEDVGLGYGIEKINDSGVRVGDLFLHSICENTTENLLETEISFIKHRFIHKDILFHYNPFTKLNLKLKSTYIEDSDTNENIPEYSIYSRSREKYIWRDILDIGFIDEDGNTIDFPFMNGCFYVYKDINFFTIPETSVVRKYALNINDISGDGDIFTNEFANIINDATIIKPYNQYSDIEC
jgi:hypothetical protein